MKRSVKFLVATLGAVLVLAGYMAAAQAQGGDYLGQGQADPSKLEAPEKERACKSDETTEWIKFDDAVQKAQKEDRPILAFFFSETCSLCKKMESEIFADPKLACYINKKLYPARHDLEKEKKLVEEILGATNVYPPTIAFVVLKPKHEVWPVIGYQDPEELRLMIAYVGDRAYLKEPDFNKYKQSRQEKNQEKK